MEVQYRSGQQYVLELEAKESLRDTFIRSAMTEMSRLSDHEKISFLGENIVEICSGNIDLLELYLSSVRIHDVETPTPESVLSVLLFYRGVAQCRACGRAQSRDGIENAFLDFNYAIYFSLSPEIIGLCSMYRAYFFPKGKKEDLEDHFIINEYSLAKVAVGSESEYFRMMFNGFNPEVITPEVLYSFIGKDTEGDGRLYSNYTSLGAIKDFVPARARNPFEYIVADPIMGRYYAIEPYASLSRQTNRVDGRILRITNV